MSEALLWKISAAVVGSVCSMIKAFADGLYALGIWVERVGGYISRGHSDHQIAFIIAFSYSFAE